MSDIGNTVTQPSGTPPPLMPSGGGYALPPNQQLEPRKATQSSPFLQEQLKLMTEEQKTAFGKQWTPSGQYVGQYLVDDKGVITRGQYNPDEAYGQLAELGTPAERRAFLNLLAANGVYGNGSPSSTGLSSTDISAMREAMLYANSRGVTVKVAARLMSTDPAVVQWRKSVGTGGGRVRTTPKEDLRAVFKAATAQVLGRDLPDSEIDRFIRSYNASEVRQAMGGAAAPSAQVAAQEAAKAAAPGEAGAVQMLGYANAVDQLMKGLG